jgi:hypothetical protein
MVQSRFVSVFPQLPRINVQTLGPEQGDKRPIGP